MTKIDDPFVEQCKSNLKNALEDPHMLGQNRDLLVDYFDHLENRSAPTKMSYVYRLRELEIFCKKPWKDITKADMKAFFVTKDARKKRTTNGYIAVFKAFFRWLYKMPKHNFPECVEYLQKVTPEPSILNRHDLITKAEFKKLLDATTEPQIKCYLSMSLEGIYRKGSLRVMRLKDLGVKDTHVIAYSYETKAKKHNIVPHVIAKPYIVAWMNVHPFKDDLESPLFVPMHPYPKKKILGYSVFNSWLRALKRATGLQKVLTPHKFRHVRTNLMLLTGYDKNLIRNLGGWADNQMLDHTYGHIEKEDNAKALLEIYGITEEKDEQSTDVKVIKCMVCGHPVSEFEQFCSRCKNAPTIQQAEKEQEKLLIHQKEEKDDIKELKARMGKLETYMHQKLVEEIVREIIKRNVR